MLKDYYGKDASALLLKKLYLFDMDGTIYLGNRLFGGVKELLEKIASAGSAYVFITIQNPYPITLKNCTVWGLKTSRRTTFSLPRRRRCF